MKWDYIAGFFDGEGCCGLHKQKGYEPSVHIQIVNTNQKVIEAIHKFLGVGHIHIREPTKHHPKRLFMLRINQYNDVHFVAKNLVDRIITKRQNLQKLISHIERRKWKRKYYSKEELNDLKTLLTSLYWNEGKSCREIARMLGKSEPTIWKLLFKLGIPRRTHSDAGKLWRQKQREGAG